MYVSVSVLVCVIFAVLHDAPKISHLRTETGSKPTRAWGTWVDGREACILSVRHHFSPGGQG